MLPTTLTIYIFQVLLSTDVPYGLLQRAVVDRLLFDRREEVRHNTVEELQVILQKLWYIDILNGPQTDQLLETERYSVFMVWV